jgi:VanZ family protein
MGLIFAGSADPASGHHSSSIFAPLVRWFFPTISPDSLETVLLYARKCGHLAEYAILAMLLWRALRWHSEDPRRPWRWPTVWLVLALAALYAASDEFHQTFVPTRVGCVRDVVIDTCGAALGLAFLLGLGAVLGLRRRHCQGQTRMSG